MWERFKAWFNQPSVIDQLREDLIKLEQVRRDRLVRLSREKAALVQAVKDAPTIEAKLDAMADLSAWQHRYREVRV